MGVLQNFRTDPQMRQVFQKMPAMLQQSIVHSGKKVNDLQDLQICAAHLAQTETEKA